MQKSQKLSRSLDVLALMLGIGIILALHAYTGDPVVQPPQAAQVPAADSGSEVAAGSMLAH